MASVNKQIFLQRVTASFVKIFEPEQKMSGNGREYSIQIIMPKDHPQINELQTAIVEMANTAFPGVTLPRDCVLIRDSDAEGKGEQYDYMKDTWFFNIRRNEKQGPVPCALPSGEMFTPDPQIIFSGCLINVHVGLFDYQIHQPGTNKIMKRGISGSLNGIQLVDNKNVTRLGGGAPVPQFSAVEGDVDVVTTNPAEVAQAPQAQPEAAAPVEEVKLPW